MAQCLNAALSSQRRLCHISADGWRWGFGQPLKYNGTRIAYTRRVSRLPRLLVSAMDSSIGGQGRDESGPPPVFPRQGVKDPFKLLGISREASEEEIREARNYLSKQYAAHEKSRKSIEAAYDKIIMDSFKNRKNPKIDLKSSLKKKFGEIPPPLRAVTNMVETPTSPVLIRRTALFLVLGIWSALKPENGGPTFQVAVSLAACIYFLNERQKSLGKAFLIGFAAFFVAWVSGTIIVPLLSSYILPSSWTLELNTALFSYIILWAACTFLK